LAALALSTSWAQQADGNLNEKQLRGRQLLAQSCGVCHLQASMGAKTFGPPLNKASANGNNDILRTFIMEGTPRMPAFKHHFKAAEVDAIIDYIRTVPVPPDTQAAP
jgi:mono/diheme cytochrome c family protein